VIAPRAGARPTYARICYENSPRNRWTGNAFAMRSTDIWRVEDGRFVEHWDELNTLDIFSQVGAVPPLGQPS
jgi:hypothetical protein